MWEIATWDEATSLLELGRGGTQGGQPPYLDQILPDGSWAGQNECCFPNSPNFTNYTNRINPGTMSRVFVEGLLAELDEAEEYYVDDDNGMLCFVFNTTQALSTADRYNGSHDDGGHDRIIPPVGNASKLGLCCCKIC